MVHIYPVRHCHSLRFIDKNHFTFIRSRTHRTGIALKLEIYKLYGKRQFDSLGSICQRELDSVVVYYRRLCFHTRLTKYQNLLVYSVNINREFQCIQTAGVHFHHSWSCLNIVGDYLFSCFWIESTQNETAQSSRIKRSLAHRLFVRSFQLSFGTISHPEVGEFHFVTHIKLALFEKDSDSRLVKTAMRSEIKHKCTRIIELTLRQSCRLPSTCTGNHQIDHGNTVWIFNHFFDRVGNIFKQLYIDVFSGNAETLRKRVASPFGKIEFVVFFHFLSVCLGTYEHMRITTDDIINRLSLSYMHRTFKSDIARYRRTDKNYNESGMKNENGNFLF